LDGHCQDKRVLALKYSPLVAGCRLEENAFLAKRKLQENASRSGCCWGEFYGIPWDSMGF